MPLVNINTHCTFEGGHNYSIDVDAYGRSLEVARVGTLADAQVIHTAVCMALLHATDPCIKHPTTQTAPDNLAWCERCERAVDVNVVHGAVLCSRCGLVL